MPTTFVETVTTRHNPSIDPTLSVWGWEIVLYLFLGGLAAGLFILSAALALRDGADETARGGERGVGVGLRPWVPGLALGLLSVGMLGLFLDLANKSNFYRFYLAVRPQSPMWWGAWVLLVAYPVGILACIAQLQRPAVEALQTYVPNFLSPLKRTLAAVHGWACAMRGGVLAALASVGAVLGIYTGILLSSMAARPVWNSAVLGPLFLASGISTGAALMLLLPLAAEDKRRLLRWDVAAIVAEVVLLGLYLIGMANGSTAARSVSAAIHGGPLAAPFWGLVVVSGLAVPLMLEIIEMRKGLRLARAAPVLLLLGGVALRAVLLAAGQHHDPTAGL